MKTFKVPEFYRSPIISQIKQFRKAQDPRKKDNSATVLDFGRVKYYVARHFGFCYGVENAIEIAFRALHENPGKRVFLLSEMIHNPDVNRDLSDRGVRFLQDTRGRQLIPFTELTKDDIVMIPAFGAPLELLETLDARGIQTEKYNTTCPFVERVWKKSQQIGTQDHTIVIHGKHDHEETRSTFSRSARDSRAVVVVRDLQEAQLLGRYISGNGEQAAFEDDFAGRFTKGFDIHRHLDRIGVINQTTMLATETQQITDFFRDVMIAKYGAAHVADHLADTRDTLCYATNENQDAAYGLLETDAHLALVVGGYNSSNTSHLAELCEQKFPTYFISSASDIGETEIRHFDFHNKAVKVTEDYLPANESPRIIITSGASCPDSLLDEVIHRLNTVCGVKADEQPASFRTFNAN